MTGKLLPILTLVLMLSSCGNERRDQTISTVETQKNPPAPGFNLANSDPNAIEIADQVMAALGGRKAWDNTNIIRWTFFGRRNLLWDKKEGKVRIEVPNDSTIYVLNLNDQSGMVKKGSQIMTHSDSLKKYLEIANRIWVNDSYWLVMPFKLKDSGVTLKYLKDSVLGKEEKVKILELTFNEVGYTPQNKYHIYVNESDSMVTQWDYYVSAEIDTPYLSTPWQDYQRYGDIMLSGKRGRFELSDIRVSENVDPLIFEDLDRFLL
jgi:hypothetical protein